MADILPWRLAARGRVRRRVLPLCVEGVCCLIFGLIIVSFTLKMRLVAQRFNNITNVKVRRFKEFQYNLTIYSTFPCRYST